MDDSMDVESLAAESSQRPIPSGQRLFTGKLGLFVRIVAIGTTLYHVLWITGTLMRLDIVIITLPHYAISLGLVLFLVFLLYPAKRSKREPKVPWYDIVFSLLSLVSCWYVAIFFESQIVPRTVTFKPLPHEVALFIILTVLLLEAGRRTTGMALPIVVLCCTAYMFTADLFPWIFYGPSFDLDFVTLQMYMGETAIWGVAMRVAATIIIAFLLFAGFLLVSGAGRFFVNIAMAIAGTVRGGPAKVSIIGSGFFGMISGSPTSNIAAIGSITIPMMKKIGYKPEFAAAVETVASVGGILMPPVMGVVAFIMAEMTGIPYAKVCLYAAVPAILYYLALFIQVDLEAARIGLKGVPRHMLPPLTKTLMEGWHYAVPVVVLVYLMAVVGYPAEVSAIYSVVALIIVSWVRKHSRINLALILNGLEYATKALLVVAPACALVGIIIGSLAVTGVAPKISGMLVTLSLGNFYLLAAISAVAAFILGLALTATPIYVSLAVLVAPVMVMQMKVPIIAAHLFLFYFAMVEAITPPTCIPAYIAAGIAEALPMATGWQATRLGIATYVVPFMFLFNPALVLQGRLADIIVSVICAITGISLLAAGAEGYVLRPLNWPERIMLLISSILVMWPNWVVRLIGTCFALVGLSGQIRIWLNARRAERLRVKTAQETIDDSA
jgi:TRAP transporter 4TM/12TM fusion protein